MSELPRRGQNSSKLVFSKCAQVDRKKFLSKQFFFPSFFLVACTRLYNSLCPLVGWLVGRLVGWSVGRSHFFCVSPCISMFYSLLLFFSCSIVNMPLKTHNRLIFRFQILVSEYMCPYSIFTVITSL